MAPVKKQVRPKQPNTICAECKKPVIAADPETVSAGDKRWDELFASTTPEQWAKLEKECLEDEDAGPLFV